MTDFTSILSVYKKGLIETAIITTVTNYYNTTPIGSIDLNTLSSNVKTALDALVTGNSITQSELDGFVFTYLITKVVGFTQSLQSFMGAISL